MQNEGTSGEQAKRHKPSKGQGGQGQKAGKGPKTRAEREVDKQKKLDRKIERAGQPDTAVVSRKALETNAMVALLGQNDYFIDQLRKKVGYDTKINVEDAMILLQTNGAIRNVVAIVNAALQNVIGMSYDPAKGLDAPVVNPAKLDLKKILETLQAIITEAEATMPAKVKDAEAPAPMANAA